MATRQYDFVSSIATGSAPSPSTPTNDTDVISKGYADDTYARRASWFDKSEDADAIRAILEADRADGQVVFNMGNNSFYRFDAASSAVDDGDTVLEPDAGTGRWLKITSSGAGGSGNSIIQEFHNQVSTFKAGEAIALNDAVCAEIHNGSGSDEYKLFKCDADLPYRSSFVGIAMNAASVTPEIDTYTISAAYVSGNSIPITINGRTYTVTYASSSDATLQSLATAIATDPDVASAVVTVVGGNQTGTDDRVITITSRGGLQLNISGTTITGGASQPNVTIQETQAAVQNSVAVKTHGPITGLTSLLTGQMYFLSTTAGAISTTPVGNQVSVGRAESTTVLFVDATEDSKFVKRWGSTELFIRSHGSSTGASAGGVSDVEHYNFSAWAAGTSQGTATYRAVCGGLMSFGGFFWINDGLNTSGSVQSLFAKYNKFTWASATNKGTNRSFQGGAAYNGFLTITGGTTTGAAANSQNTYDKYDNASWGTGTAWTQQLNGMGMFVYSGILHSIGGQDTGGTSIGTHYTKNTSDTNNTDTAFPAAGVTRPCALPSAGSKAIVLGVNGDGSTTGAQEWAGSWSAKTASYAQVTYYGQGGFFNSYALTLTNGGQTADGSSVINTSQTYNGTTFSSATSSSNSRGGGLAAVL